MEKELDLQSESSDENLDEIKEELEKEVDDLEDKDEETKGEPVELGFIEIKPGDNWMEAIAQKIMEQAHEQKERDLEYKKDDLNKQFIEACNSKHLQIETFEDDFVYFRKLNKQDKRAVVTKLSLQRHFPDESEYSNKNIRNDILSRLGVASGEYDDSITIDRDSAGRAKTLKKQKEQNPTGFAVGGMIHRGRKAMRGAD